jgi:hypothetical protein
VEGKKGREEGNNCIRISFPSFRFFHLKQFCENMMTGTAKAIQQ